MTWRKFERPESCDEVSVGSARHIWIRVGQNTLRSDWKGGWEPIGEEHQSISVGSDGVGVIVTSLLHPDAHEVQIFDPTIGEFRAGYGDNFKQVAYGTMQHIWGVRSNNNILRYTGEGNWERQSQVLRQITVAQDGTVCGVNHRDVPFRLHGKDWQQLPGKMRHISAGSSQEIWGIGASNRHPVLRLSANGKWEQQPGAMARVSVGADGTVLGIDRNKRLHRWMG